MVVVRGLHIGEDVPKICVPMTGTGAEEINREAVALAEAGAQMAEWRVDWFRGWNDREQVSAVLKELRDVLGEIPLLVTFRTKQEGGNNAISKEEYRELYGNVLESGQADLIDLELYFDEAVVKELIAEAKRFGVKTVLSSHDFQATPSEAEICQRLRRMEELGADIAKIAVMPRTSLDVAVLMKATAICEKELSCPLITMSMGGLGVISRMAGQIFGSSVTFASVGRTSAPGQIPLQQLNDVLKLIDDVQ